MPAATSQQQQQHHNGNSNSNSNSNLTTAAATSAHILLELTWTRIAEEDDSRVTKRIRIRSSRR